MFKISSKYLDVVLNTPITSDQRAYQQKETSYIPSHNKKGINLQPGEHN